MASSQTSKDSTEFCARSYFTQGNLLYKSRARISMEAVVLSVPLLLGWHAEYQHIHVPLHGHCLDRSDFFICSEPQQHVVKPTDARSKGCQCASPPRSPMSIPNDSSWTFADQLIVYLSPSSVLPAKATLSISASLPFIWQIYPKATMFCIFCLWYCANMAALALFVCLGFSLKGLLLYLFDPKKMDSLHPGTEKESSGQGSTATECEKESYTQEHLKSDKNRDERAGGEFTGLRQRRKGRARE